MPPDRFPPDDPREWLNRARSNLLRAKNHIPGVYLEDLCLDAQQAAEKAIKGVMILRGIEFPYIHDLRLLLGTLEASGETIEPDLLRAGNLSRYASATRYPFADLPISEAEYREAVEIAGNVVSWAERLCGEVRSP
ncbi:MAG: HEPN domain-containing protein [Rhodospirillaceae bacterium]|nr:HEPN domain-containing protein [Rhodospirillaceae bacterium]MCY4066023.1 HEPN domain-containing protein [Rhodospirillaceae bacterium]